MTVKSIENIIIKKILGVRQMGDVNYCLLVLVETPMCKYIHKTKL